MADIPQPVPENKNPQSRIMAVLSRMLPKTGPSILSTSRAPAGEALQAANFMPEKEAPQGPIERLNDIPNTAANALPDVPALHTYRGDIASSMEERNISLATIAQAETARRAAGTKPQGPGFIARNWLRLLEVGLGFILIAGAVGVLGWTYVRVKPLPPAPAANAPFIYVDKKAEIIINPTGDRTQLMSKLVGELSQSSLPFGLVEHVALSVASTTPGATAPLTTRPFFALIAPRAPDSLVRALSPRLMVGVYANDGIQPFLIFKTDSYEQAYAGMLDWEDTIQNDLAPFFPKQAVTNIPAPMLVATSSASSTDTAPRSSTTPSREGTVQVLQTPFVDSVVSNHDVRIISGDQGIILLWAFVDRQTLVIAANASTLTELVSRLQKAPTITVPN